MSDKFTYDPTEKKPLLLKGLPSKAIMIFAPTLVGSVLALPLVYFNIDGILASGITKLLPGFINASKLPAAMPLLSFTGLSFLLSYLSVLSVSARTDHKVPHPIQHPSDGDVSVEDRHMFLCKVRPFQNYLETAPESMASLALVSYALHKPFLAAALTSILIGGRVLYAKGYASGYPHKRELGFFLSFLPVVLFRGVIISHTVLSLLSE